uniref:Large ribosomal subunit protein uL18c n=1 Tax=Poteriospumella lacustris TaxID=1117027 RepID=A0A7S6T9X4_9STRA|nr:ribosomal protein L18 [Poteriospumella lacustris]
MKKKLKKLYIQSKKRYLKKIFGTAERQRLSVYRSHKHIYAQIIDDQKGHTLCSASTLSKNYSHDLAISSPKAKAFKIGELIANAALEKNVGKVVFDSGKHIYHGRIKSLAEGARTKGLSF